MEKKLLEKEITETFNEILKICDNKSFSAVKAALLLARDHIVKSEVLSSKDLKENIDG